MSGNAHLIRLVEQLQLRAYAVKFKYISQPLSEAQLKELIRIPR